jgi:hypothetical protein
MTPEEMIAAAREIAAKLKAADKIVYKDVFAWVAKTSAWKTLTPASVVLDCLRALEREFNNGHKPRQLFQYLNGARRKILAERKAKEFRNRRGAIDRVQPAGSIGEILAGLKIGGK